MKNFYKFAFLAILLSGCELIETNEFLLMKPNDTNTQITPYFEFSSQIFTDSINYYYKWVKSGDTCFNTHPGIRLVMPSGNYTGRKFECVITLGSDTVYQTKSSIVDSNYYCQFTGHRAHIIGIYQVYGNEIVNNKTLPFASATLILRFPKR